jgi:branched-chain amino acid transport system permease protein
MIAQHLANLLSMVSSYALIGLSFWLVFRLSRFLNVCHAVPYVLAPYLVCAAIVFLPVWLAVVVALLLCGALNAASDAIVFRALRARGATPLVMLLASFGMYAVVQNAVSMVFGDDPRPLFPPVTLGTSVVLLGAHISLLQMWRVLLCAATAVALALLARRTNWGRSYRAVTANPQLASVVGIPIPRLYLQVYLLGGVLAGIAGILAAADTFMDPSMGLQALFMAVVVVVLAGSHGIAGVLVSAVILASCQLAAVTVTSSLWHNTTAFVLLFAFIWWRSARGHRLFNEGLSGA